MYGKAGFAKSVIMDKNKIYTATDFANYHAGKMPASEMHELEKAALEDPFLADALDGFMYSQNIESDITELRERLNEKQKRKNVFALSITQNVWWRIAALLIIIAGGGYLFYRINYNTKEASIAKNEIQNKKNQTDSFALNQKDSATVKNDVAFENKQASASAQKEKKLLPQLKPRPERKFSNDEEKIEPVLAQSENDSISFKDKNFKKDYYAQAPVQYILKGKVTDEKGNPVAFASIKNSNNNKAAVTDTTGKFLLQSPDSNATAVISAVGFSSKKVTLQKDEQPTIAINKNASGLSEVVVIGYGKSKNKKKADSVSNALSGKVAGVEIRKSQNKLLVHNNNFDEYLQKNITPVYNENNERQSGEVLLSFTLNKKGRPQNIKVIKSSCTFCEAEAIRLLQNGPDWVGKKNQQGSVSIKFQ